jgi:hypothetical protein
MRHYKVLLGINMENFLRQLSRGRKTFIPFSFGFVTAVVVVLSTSVWFRLISIPISSSKNRRKLALFFGDSITQEGWSVESRG